MCSVGIQAGLKKPTQCTDNVKIVDTQLYVRDKYKGSVMPVTSVEIKIRGHE
jgi:hypothetical protein